MPWRRQWHPTPVLLPGKSHGWRSLEGCSPWGRWRLDMTERLHFHFSLSCIREGNGNPLQCSCLENPRDGGAWWAAVYGVAQSRTRLKRLSSSSSIPLSSEQRLFNFDKVKFVFFLIFPLRILHRWAPMISSRIIKFPLCLSFMCHSKLNLWVVWGKSTCSSTIC